MHTEKKCHLSKSQGIPKKKKKKKKKKWAQNTKAAWISIDPGSGSLSGSVPSGLSGKENSGKVFSASQDALIELSNRYSAKYCCCKNLKFPRRSI